MDGKIIALVSLILAGCASHTGVLQMGPNTYTLSVGVAGTGSVSGNDTKAKAEALAEANRHCKTMDKTILVQNISLQSTYGGSTQEVIFQCLTDSEAKAHQNTTYRKEPNVVIETRN